VSASAASAKTRVLIVDDEPSVLLEIAASLKRHYDPLTASNADEAEKILAVSKETLYRWIRDGFVTAEQITARFLEEAQMVGRMSWCRNRAKHAVAGGNRRAVGGELLTIARRHTILADDDCLRPSREQRGHARHVIEVIVRDQDPRERRRVERCGHGVDVGREADACVDERRLAAAQKPGVVPGRSRPLGGVPCRNQLRGAGDAHVVFIALSGRSS